MNPFKNLASYFLNVLKALGGQLKVKVVDFLRTFVKEDLGILAVDSVLYAQTLTNASSDEKKQAAKAKLIADLKTAGKDVESFGESLLNFLIESALQAVKSGLAK